MILVGALLLDKWWGEPRRWHPLVGFGNFATLVEARLNRRKKRVARGVAGWLLVVTPPVALIALIDGWLANHATASLVFSIGIVYLALGNRSLEQHAMAVAIPLKAGDPEGARDAVARIVSRDTRPMNATDIAAGATESVLENGADAVFGTLFWFLILGVPGAVLHRLANTLDAMWGYRSTRFQQFGWWSARFDDAMNFIPARLTALTYSIVGNTRTALHCWWRQGRHLQSPNAGPVMASGAGAIGISLGGNAYYHGELEIRPRLGPEHSDKNLASADSIASACGLVRRGIWVWIAIAIVLGYLGLV